MTKPDARTTPTLADPKSAREGTKYIESVAQHVSELWNRVPIVLTGISGINSISASAAPPFVDGLADGMYFILQPVATNTDDTDIDINGAGALPLVDRDGGAMAPGFIKDGGSYPILYLGGKFYALTVGASVNGAISNYQKFTENGTWERPPGVSDDAVLGVEGWAGGGGGAANATGGGGGGGGYDIRFFRVGDIAATVPVTVGAGGAVNSDGGTTSFGSYMTVYPGRAGTNTANGSGGNGGAPDGYDLGGSGGSAATEGTRGRNGDGGGGAGGGGSTARNGGAAYKGGGGGAGRRSSGTQGTGGVSVCGGNGGAPGSAGSAPAGGGGQNAPGARGEIRCYLVG